MVKHETRHTMRENYYRTNTNKATAGGFLHNFLNTGQIFTLVSVVIQTRTFIT